MPEEKSPQTRPANTYVVIMAGGVGSRFWPASRTEKPKQFLDIMGTGKSLLRMTFERFLYLCPVANIMVITNTAYRELVQGQLPELETGQVVCEPSRNNTAPCVAYASFKLLSLNPDANVVVAPSDHLILQERIFLDKIREALAFTSSHDALLTLGIKPTRADTGYGYIQYDREGLPEDPGVHKVKRFTEKPPPKLAGEFLERGDYLWNAGIFVWRASSVLMAFRQYATEIFDILAQGEEVYNKPAEQAFIDKAYPSTPSLSVDYAIMEKADNIFTLPSSFGWSDLGTWTSLHELLPKDDYGNSIQADKVIPVDSSKNLLRVQPGKTLVVGGLHDFIVVDEEDVLLIWPKSREQEIKKLPK